MGTRCEIYVRTKYGDGSIGVSNLWKHWDGGPEGMMPMLKKFAEWMGKAVGDQAHWLLQHERIAGMLIVFDYLRAIENYEEAVKNHPDHAKYYTQCADIRLRGNILDAEYAYVIDLGTTEDQMRVQWHIKCLDGEGFENLVAEGKEPEAMMREDDDGESTGIPIQQTIDFPEVKQSGVMTD